MDSGGLLCPIPIFWLVLLGAIVAKGKRSTTARGAKFERREAVQRKEEERKGVGLVRTRRPLKGRSLSGATGPQRPRVDSRWGQDYQVSDAVNKKALQAAIIPRL